PARKNGLYRPATRADSGSPELWCTATAATRHEASSRYKQAKKRRPSAGAFTSRDSSVDAAWKLRDRPRGCHGRFSYRSLTQLAAHDASDSIKAVLVTRQRARCFVLAAGAALAAARMIPPALALTAVQSVARDIGPAGFDDETGLRLVQADGAV